jgi:predicted thioesterase
MNETRPQNAPKTKIEVGKIAYAEITVTEKDTARAMVGGKLEVLSTPSLTALMEKAALATIENTLAEGEITIGLSVTVQHTNAAPVNSNVRATARIVAVDGRRVTFEVSANDESLEIGKGNVVFMVVDEKRFIEKINRTS